MHNKKTKNLVNSQSVNEEGVRYMNQKPFITGNSSQREWDIWNTQQIVQEVAKLNQTAQINNETLQNYIAISDKKFNLAIRKKRKSCVNRCLSIRTDGLLVLLESFDDGSQEAKDFSINLWGEWQVSRVKLKFVEDTTERFYINFPACGIWLMGNMKKINGNGLYDLFIKSGVKFFPSLSEKTIQQALSTTFAPQIENTCNEINIQELAGWYQGKFYYWEMLNYPIRSDFPQLPVQKKHFVMMEPNDTKVSKFGEVYANITLWKNRLYLLEIQVMGLLASIFDEENLSINFFLNLVFVEDVPYILFLKLLQIFDRKNLNGIDCSLNERELRKYIKGINDEVLIADATTVRSDYKKKKAEENAAEISRKICKKGNSSMGILREIHASLVVLNQQSICLPECINILVAQDFITNISQMEDMLNNNVVEAFLSAFINFSEKNMHDIRDIIRTEKNKKIKYEQRLFSAAFEILKLFFQKQGTDIYNELKLPNNIDFTLLVEDIKTEDIIEKCINVIRKEMKNYVIQRKMYGKKAIDDACYYNEEKIWIPTAIFNCMLKKNGLFPFKIEFLAYIKETGNLFTDNTGLSMKMQVGEKRNEYYVFSRDVFNRPGTIDIIHLGKEK